MVIARFEDLVDIEFVIIGGPAAAVFILLCIDGDGVEQSEGWFVVVETAAFAGYGYGVFCYEDFAGAFETVLYKVSR